MYIVGKIVRFRRWKDGINIHVVRRVQEPLCSRWTRREFSAIPWRDVLLNPSAGFDSQSIRNRFDAACSQNLSLILSYPLNLPYLISPLSLSLFRPSETFAPRVKVYMIELLTDLSLVESLRGSMKNNFSI